jgi:hypothetical protein
VTKAADDPVVQLLAAFRGEVSESCDYCDAQDVDLYPEEGGLWICLPCLNEVMKEPRV